MNPNTLTTSLFAADQNLAASSLYRNQHAKGSSAKVTDDYILFHLGIEAVDGHLNGALCLGKVDPDQFLKEAKYFFKNRGHGSHSFVIWVRDHADQALESDLKSQGFTPVRVPGSTGMWIQRRIQTSAFKTLPDQYALTKVTTSQHVTDYAAVIQDAFDKSPEVVSAMYSGDASLIGDEVSAWLIYHQKQPVAAATTIISGHTAGIYYVGTVKEERGKGLGAWITSAATNAAFDLGAERVILQASLAGEKVYQKLGFEPITHYRWYVIRV